MELSDREQAVLDLIVRNPLVSQSELADQLGLTRSSVAGYVMRLTEKGAIRGRGYVLNDAPYAAVIGGANVDIEGRSAGAVVTGESCPGQVRRSPGGVGRNIAERLAAQEIDTRLITALGNDVSGQWLYEQTSDAGVDLTGTLWCDDSTATYLAVLDDQGELVTAINEMGIVDRLDAHAIAERTTSIENAAVVVADCNLSEAALTAVAERSSELFVDPVSGAKANRIAGALHLVHTIKPNRLELAELSGRRTEDLADVESACAALLDRGVTRVVVSLGADGAFLAEAGIAEYLPADPVDNVVSVTGAGDAMTAALAGAHVQGLQSLDAVRFALASAADVLVGAPTRQLRS